MTEAAIYTCSICNEPSTDICVRCTKDACRNHRCFRCKRCSDCCECEEPLGAPEPEPLDASVKPATAETAAEAARELPELFAPEDEPVAAPEPKPEPPD